MCHHFTRSITSFMRILKLLYFFALISPAVYAQKKGNSSLVNPFIGASTSVERAGSYHGLGKTFPGACSPFGMVQVSPNTITGGDNGSGYSYEHTSIEGFSLMQMSGVGWYGDLGIFLVTPTNGKLHTASGKPEETTGYRSGFEKSTESASAGYYEVMLEKYKIHAEMTTGMHSGILRFRFPENQQSRIQIDLARRVGGTAIRQYVKVVNSNTIQGWILCTPEGGGWGNGDGKPNYKVYFHAQFSKPLTNVGIWSAAIPEGANRKREAIESEAYQKIIAGAEIFKDLKEMEGKHLGFYSEFPTDKDEEVMLKAGLSFVSIAGAQQNLEAEIPDWNFSKALSNCKTLWDNALDKINISGGTPDQRKVFYTALYHTMIDPRIVADVDGSYLGGDGAVHHPTTFTKRSIFSGWDVFRSQFPLQTLINPKLVNDMLSSLITLSDENGTGYFDRWEFLNAYSGCMVGNPATIVLADAYAKGIRNYDIEKAYAMAKKTAEKFGNGSTGYHLQDPVVSNTLEYAYADWCLAQLAKRLNKKEDAKIYAKAALNYQSVFNDSVGWFRPRNPDGRWEKWPAAGILEYGYGAMESNLYQQGWFVPHDVDGLAKLLGGKEKALKNLKYFFAQTPDNFGWNNYYNHANEPVHHMPFLFNHLGQPSLTQYYTRKITANAYHNAVEGLVGNDDTGQMSAWYVLASIGIHPLCPGDTRYEMTSPLFDKVILKAGKKPFIIETIHNSPENVYIKKAWLNGKLIKKRNIDYFDMVKGGKLLLEMSKTPADPDGI